MIVDGVTLVSGNSVSLLTPLPMDAKVRVECPIGCYLTLEIVE